MAEQIQNIIEKLKHLAGDYVITDDDFYESEEIANFPPRAMFKFFRGELAEDESNRVYELAKESKLFLDDLIGIGEMIIRESKTKENEDAFHQDRYLTPAQAAALDAAAERPPSKIKGRDLPSRKKD
tara:strand:- start:207 stop:587 length:381 start_codon:yes stop_codon:yes gene_type:complete